MQSQGKIFEVDQIVCRRHNNKGADEYLVTWKGFRTSSATWEPVENLISCTDLIQQYQRLTYPIPGANPYILSPTEITKTVHVKMLKNKQCNKRKSSTHLTPVKKKNIRKRNGSHKEYDDIASNKENNKKLIESDITSNKENNKNPIENDTASNKENNKKLTESDTTSNKENNKKPKENDTTPKKENNKKLTESYTTPKKENNKKLTESYTASNKENNKKLTESERLIRDTLLHEAKSFKLSNGIHDRISDLMKSYGTNFPFNGTPKKFTSMKKKKGFRNEKMWDNEHVLHTIEKGYMKICLNNISRNNLITIEMLQILKDCLQKARNKDDIKAVVITNKGDYFSSGLDYADLLNTSDDKDYNLVVNDLIDTLRLFLDNYLFFSKPIICAINGHVMEFGFSLVVGADFSFMSSSKATFDMMFGKLNLSPIGGLTTLLPYIIGPGKAKAVMLGDKFSAKIAYDCGLVSDTYNSDSFEEDLNKRMAEIVSTSARVLQKTKKLTNSARNLSLSHIEDELTSYKSCLMHKDGKQKIKEDWTTLVGIT